MKTNTYTTIGACTQIGREAPLCNNGWTSVGLKPGCLLSEVPGSGSQDAYNIEGYQRICKKTSPSTGDMGIDCCSDLYGISESLECKARGFSPYSWSCNKIMSDACNSSVNQDPYRFEWNGQAGGQSAPVFRPCAKKALLPSREKQPGCPNNEWCTNYLRNAPPNNFFHDHNYTDYLHNFPRYSYATPQFDGQFGYQPMRTPYHPYTEFQWKNASDYCYKHPEECWNTFINSYYK